jgi:hypothetical protein
MFRPYLGYHQASYRANLSSRIVLIWIHILQSVVVVVVIANMPFVECKIKNN